MPAMSKLFTAGALVAALISTAAGHTSVEKIEIGGKTYDGFRGVDKDTPETGADGPAWRTNQGWGYTPVMGSDINNPDIIAHKDAEPSSNSADAPAGSKVKFTWHHTGECLVNEEGWDCSHHGWTATYLAPCNGDCSSVTKTDLKFFKIHEAALLKYPQGTRFAKGQSEEQLGYWGTDDIFYNNGNTQEVTIPKDIPSGNYVLRTEVASIHNNGDVAERQFWPQAFNIKVTGGDDNAEVPEGVAGTEIYHADDALLQWNIYWHEGPDKPIEDAPGPKLASVAVASKVRRDHARDFSS